MTPLDDYAGHDGLGLAELVRRGETSSAELCAAAWRRVEAHNPRLNAVIRRFDPARLPPPGDGPFAGVPFLLKDLLSSVAGQPLSGGSRLLVDYRALRDSELVRRYRAAGLVFLGQTNTPEFGLAQVTEPRLYGPTRNPWNPDHTPGGSSGGAAAAVASGMVPLAGGGDGGGSIRIPAASCGLVGLKPSRGRVPTGPELGELWAGMVTEHVLTHSVRDSAALLDAIAGPECGALYSAPPPATSFLDTLQNPPRRLRIAFSDEAPLPVPVADCCRAAVARAARLCEALGHRVEEARLPAIGMTFFRDFVRVVAVCTAAELDYLRTRLGLRGSRHNLETATRLLARLGRLVGGAEALGAVQRLQQLARAMGVFHEQVDVLITPVTALPPPRIGKLAPRGVRALLQTLLAGPGVGRLLRWPALLDASILDGFRFTPFPPVQNATGQPALAVPMGLGPDGLPRGVQLVGRYGDEATLLGLAAQLETVEGWRERHPPGWF